MHEHLEILQERIGFAELATIGVLVLAFLFGGVIGGTPVTIFRTCSGIVQAECPPDKWVALNPAAGLLTAVGAVIALVVLDAVMRLRHR